MGMTYFKRFRMEIDLLAQDLSMCDPPPEYRLVAWDPALARAHAETKYESFRFELDANVFPCLGDRAGCLRLMNEISQKEGFLPEATWLITFPGTRRNTLEYCGTIQGICDGQRQGAIQNVGVTPNHRGRGLGTTLIHNALRGFRSAGLERAYLEVTAQNEDAIRLYKRLGFRPVRIVYKGIEVATV